MSKLTPDDLAVDYSLWKHWARPLAPKKTEPKVQHAKD